MGKLVRRMNFNNFSNASEIPYWPQIRYQIDLAETINGADVQGIAFNFKTLPLNYTIMIQMEDKLYKCRRPLPDTAMRQYGDKINLKRDTGGTNLKFYVQIKQEIFEDEDTSVNCLNYPTTEYDNYDHCDSIFINDSLTNLGLGNITPVWMTEDINKATDKFEITSKLDTD